MRSKWRLAARDASLAERVTYFPACVVKRLRQSAEGSPVAKRKKAQPWDALFDRVRVIYDADRKYPPTPGAEFDVVEAQLGFRFPLSYRAFATHFGLGGRLRHYPIELYLLHAP